MLLLKYVKDEQFQIHYINYLKLKKAKTREDEISHLLSNYDFIGISERIEESLVILSAAEDPNSGWRRYAQ
jgi:hypothetical protein